MIAQADAVAGDVCFWDGANKVFGRFVDEGGDSSTDYYSSVNH